MTGIYRSNLPDNDRFGSDCLSYRKRASEGFKGRGCGQEMQCKKIEGAYALVVSSPRKLIGARDPFGSQTALHRQARQCLVSWHRRAVPLLAVGADFIRDVVPGEIVSFTTAWRYLRTEVCSFHRKSRHVVFLSTFILHVRTAVSTASVYIMPGFVAGTALAQASSGRG